MGRCVYTCFCCLLFLCCCRCCFLLCFQFRLSKKWDSVQMQFSIFSSSFLTVSGSNDAESNRRFASCWFWTRNVQNVTTKSKTEPHDLSNSCPGRHILLNKSYILTLSRKSK